MKTKIKICGVMREDEIKTLDELDVSYAGLWYGIPDGKFNLDLDTFINLASLKTSNLEFVLVTLLHDIALLREVIDKSDVKCIQFHGFQTPAFISKIKQEFGDDLKIFKVLHVSNNKCAEDGLIHRYIDSGTDVLILDSYQDKKRIGSTGIQINNNFINEFISSWGMNNKIMLAGGINQQTVRSICEYHNPYGIDIDSAARNVNGISRNRVSEIITQSNLYSG
jgi:phosphoribosylanthranilate isomerase